MDMNGVNRYEIDTSSPFGSVKEAISLFGEGERVLAMAKAKEVQLQPTDNGDSKIGEIAAELEETKQSLEKAREEGTLLANSLSCLQEELDRTKTELHKLQKRESRRREKETEGVKWVEPPGSLEAEFQKCRYVSFASPPTVDQTGVPRYKESPRHKHPPLDKNKKAALLPLIGGLLQKKKQAHATTAKDCQGHNL